MKTLYTVQFHPVGSNYLNQAPPKMSEVNSWPYIQVIKMPEKKLLKN